MGVLRTELGLAKNDRRFPLKGTCMDIYSRCVNAREPVEEAVETHFPWCKDEVDDLRRLFAAYVDHKGEQSVLDYDDLLLFWHGLLTDPRAARSIRGRFDCVLVDEYQDTNRLQAEILRDALPRRQGSHRGGRRRPGHLLLPGGHGQEHPRLPPAVPRHPRRHPGAELPQHPAAPRCHQPGHRRRDRAPCQEPVVPAHREAIQPQLVSCEDEDEQTEFVIRQVLEHREAGLALHRQAVLFRASHHSLALELELTRRNIPFHKYGGLRFVETAHVKDLLAFLRLAENPRDLMAGTRVLMLLPGVGPKKATALMDLLATGTAGRTARPRRSAPCRGRPRRRPPAPSAAAGRARRRLPLLGRLPHRRRRRRTASGANWCRS